MPQQDDTAMAQPSGLWARMVDGGVYYMLPNLLFLGFSFLPYVAGTAPLDSLPWTILAVVVIAIVYVGVALAASWPLWARIAWLLLLAGSIAVLGLNGLYFVMFVALAIALLLPLPAALPSIAVVSITAGIASAATGELVATLLAIVALLGGIALALARVIWERNDRLKAAEQRVATLAVATERARIGRDLHDILGHSLTTITVKAQLVAALIERDPQRAKAEIADLEAIARTALADVRSTASGMQSVRVATEIASARSVLTAAGVQADTPSAMPDLSDARNELFGYVVREAVTNVVRHAGATRCTIVLGPAHVAITDDGRGGARQANGSGLAGLRSRVEEAGLLLVVRSGTNGTTIRAEAS